MRSLFLAQRPAQSQTESEHREASLRFIQAHETALKTLTDIQREGRGRRGEDRSCGSEGAPLVADFPST
jgi:hypothetical protein